jgi:hypothetical protein
MSDATILICGSSVYVPEFDVNEFEDLQMY